MVELTVNHMLRAQIPERFYNVTLSEARVSAEIMHKLNTYRIRMPTILERGYGLYLWSEAYGTGKTSIAVCLLKAAMHRRYSALFIDAPSLKGVLAKDTPFDEGASWSQRLMDVDLLVIDDLGKEYQSGSGFGEKAVENLIRERIQHNKSTIITGNLRPEALAKTYSTSLLSLFQETMAPLEITGYNWRTAKEKDLKDLLNGEAE